MRARLVSRTRSGAAAVEMAVILNFVMIPLMIGLWEMGRVVQVQQIVSNAAREGARMAAQATTINQSGSPTQIKTAVFPNTTNEPNVKAAVMQYLSGAGLNRLVWTDVDVTFAFIDSPPGAIAGATQPFQGVKNQRFRVTVTIQDTASNKPLRDRVLWTALGLVRPQSVSYSADWQMLVDDTFSVNVAIPGW